MSYKELAKKLIDQVPDSKMHYIVDYLQRAAIPEEIPNAETLEALEGVEEMTKAGSGQHFQGIVEEFTDMLLVKA